MTPLARRRAKAYAAFVIAVAATVWLLRAAGERGSPPRAPVRPSIASERPEAAPGSLAWEVRRLLAGERPGVADASANSVRAIAGGVVDAGSGRPVPGAGVYPSHAGALYAPSGPGGPEATSDSEDRFELRRPFADASTVALVVVAWRNGFAAGKAPVPGGPDAGPAVVTLRRGLSLAGSVTTSAGAPVAGATVVCAGPNARTATPRTGRRFGDVALDGSPAAVSTELDGSFVVGGLAEHVDLVQAQRFGFVLPPGAAEYVERSPEEAEPIRLTLDPLVGVRVRVRDRLTGEPVSVWGGFGVTGAAEGLREIRPWHPDDDPSSWSGGTLGVRGSSGPSTPPETRRCSGAGASTSASAS